MKRSKKERAKQLEEIRKELLSRKAEILNKLVKNREEFAQNFEVEGDLADEASAVIERELIYDLSVAEREELEEIEEALKRLDEGTYGICISCGAQIPIERLKIKPFARYCVKCREKHEREKFFGKIKTRAVGPTFETEEPEEESE